jgi:hypothetical protein
VRIPSITGEPFLGKYFWDHRRDVEYEEIETGSGLVDLSFLKPFILTRRDGSTFLRNLSLPITAKEVLNMKTGNPVSLVADPDLRRLKTPMSRIWNILFLGISPSEIMERLGTIDLNIYEVAQVFEMKQFLDMSTDTRHPTRIAVNRIRSVNIPNTILEYERISGWLLSRGAIEEVDSL